MIAKQQPLSTRAHDWLEAKLNDVSSDPVRFRRLQIVLGVVAFAWVGCVGTLMLRPTSAPETVAALPPMASLPPLASGRRLWRRRIRIPPAQRPSPSGFSDPLRSPMAFRSRRSPRPSVPLPRRQLRRRRKSRHPWCVRPPGETKLRLCRLLVLPQSDRSLDPRRVTTDGPPSTTSQGTPWSCPTERVWKPIQASGTDWMIPVT